MGPAALGRVLEQFASCLGVRLLSAVPVDPFNWTEAEQMKTIPGLLWPLWFTTSVVAHSEEQARLLPCQASVFISFVCRCVLFWRYLYLTV